MRTKRAFYNMITGGGYYILYTILGLVNRKVMLHFLGIEYQGINGLFTNILSMLGIAELGIGTAIIYNLYKPIRDDDINQIKSIMAFYKKCYFFIALAIMVTGCILGLKLDFFVGANSLSINVKAAYFLMLAEVIASYTFAYKRSLLYADQKNYIVSLLNIFYVVGNNIVQIMILCFTQNYYLFLISKIVFRLSENLLINIITIRFYPYIKEKDALPLDKKILDDIVLKVKGLIFHKIGAFCVNGTDNILISKLIGIATVGMYSNYKLILVSINGVLGQVFEGVTASVGNLLASGEKQKGLVVFDELRLLNLGLTNFAAVSFFIMSSTFIGLLFGEKYELENNIIIILSLNFAYSSLRSVYGIFKSASGIQYEDRFVPICEAVINLAASLVFYQLFGFFGIFFGTLISNGCVFLYTFPILVYRDALGGDLKKYYAQLLESTMFILLNGMLCKAASVCIVIDNSIMQLMFEGILCLIIPNAAFFLYFRKRPEFEFLLKRIKRLLSRKKNIEG